MINNTVDDVNYNRSTLLSAAETILTPFNIALGKEDTIENKTHCIGVRILAGIVALIILPLTLTAYAIKWWKGTENLIVNLDNNHPYIDVNHPYIDIEGMLEDEQEKLVEKINADVKSLQEVDVKLGDPVKGSWRAYGEKNGETNQTFDSYVGENEQNMPDLRPLHIQRIGSFNKLDLKIISITCDFLNQMYQLPIKLDKAIITVDQLREKYFDRREEDYQKRLLGASENEEEIKDAKKIQKIIKNYMDPRIENFFPRDNGQYDGVVALDIMQPTIQKDLSTEEDKYPQLIAFTSEDLFDQDMQNFVFGVAYRSGTGIWSNARFGDPAKSPEDFQKCLFRMMKIAAHEFGHMRGIEHCTDYECNMGGYMSRDELDSRPFLFCAQDTAKVCYLSQISILAHEQKLLKFFQSFNTNYQLDYDFSKEIGILNNRITKLQQIAA